ncbi:MAG: hypothetical protein AAF724_02055 [Pseudomonadota bacterium]
MVDFVAVIEKAVNGLTNNTPEMRQKVYEKARGAIRRQLASINPPVSETVRHKQLAKLEEAIQQIEEANADPLPSVDEDAFAEFLSDGNVDEDDIGEEEEVVAAPAKPMRRPPRRQQPVLGPEAEDEDDSYDDVYANDSVRSDGGRVHDAEVSEYLSPRKRRLGGTVIGAVAVFVLLVALAMGWWTFGDRLTALVLGTGDGSQSSEITSNDAAPSEEALETNVVAGDTAGQRDAVSGAAPTDDSQKFTQRLLSDGTEVDAGPGANSVTDGDSEGRSVAALDDESTESLAAVQPAPVDTPTVEPGDQATAPGQASTPSPLVSQKMFLYEERLGQQAPAAEQGTVIWNIVRESPGDELPPEPAIEAQINVPAKGISAIMTIKRNADQSLPASHLIEIVFALTEQFEGEGIGAIQNFAMKQTEQDTGDSLIAVPAKITDSFFMIALNDYVEAVDLNLRLLRERNWIDLPVSYGNGRRALLTMEKGSSGAEVFNQVIRAWEARATSSTQ